MSAHAEMGIFSSRSSSRAFSTDNLNFPLRYLETVGCLTFKIVAICACVIVFIIELFHNGI